MTTPRGIARISFLAALSIATVTFAAESPSGDFKPPAVGTAFDWKIDGKSSTSHIVAISGRVITWQNEVGTHRSYASLADMQGPGGEDLRLDTDEFDKLWPLAVGKTASSQEQLGPYSGLMTLKVVGYEKVTVGAGTFDAFIIDKAAKTIGSQFGYAGDTKLWFVPTIGNIVKFDYRETGGRFAGRAISGEMIAFHPPK